MDNIFLQKNIINDAKIASFKVVNGTVFKTDLVQIQVPPPSIV